MKEPLPSPGSTKAVEQGCTCPVEVNNRGRFAPYIGGWWINPICPLHKRSGK